MYRTKEVERLVRQYTDLRTVKDNHGHGLRVLILLADLDRAVSLLPPKEYQAILLYGFLGHTVRDAEHLLGVSRTTLHDRFVAGICWITKYLNEGEE